MTALLNKFARAVLPDRVIDWIRSDLLDRYAIKSYSQEGEDLILRRLFAGRRSGFYVDVGAHHPRRFSNTYLFYKQGWRGMNIDAMPGSMRAFNRHRPRDINVECAISLTPREIRYYIFNEPALNGFSEQLSLLRNSRDSPYRVVETRMLATRQLRQVLAQHVPEGQHIDFMSVDVEGMDLEVLQSNDWSQFRPDVVLVEILSSSLDGLLADPIAKFMTEQGYRVFAKCVNTVIFEKNSA